MFRLGFLSIVILFLGSFALESQWGSGNCQGRYVPLYPAPQVLPDGPITSVQNESYEWTKHDKDPDIECLYKGVRYAGCWNYKEQQFHPYDSFKQQWGNPIKKAPIELPVKQNFGVEREKYDGDTKCSRNGQPITVEEVKDIIQGKIPNDLNKLRITVIGDKVNRDIVKKAYFNDLEAEIRDQLIFWDVPPDHFSLKDTVTGQTVYKVNGNPTIYIQGPDGRVLHRQDNFNGSKDFVAIRKVVKNYDPAKDPDLRQQNPAPVPTPVPVPPPAPNPAPNPTPNPLEPLKNVPMPWWLVGGLFIIAFLVKKFDIQLSEELKNKLPKV
jgi:hypothetical protein